MLCASPTAASCEVTSSLARIDFTCVRTVASDTTLSRGDVADGPTAHQVGEHLALPHRQQVEAGLQLLALGALVVPVREQLLALLAAHHREALVDAAHRRPGSR